MRTVFDGKKYQEKRRNYLFYIDVVFMAQVLLITQRRVFVAVLFLNLERVNHA